MLKVFTFVKQNGVNFVKESERVLMEKLLRCMMLIMQSKVAQNLDAFDF